MCIMLDQVQLAMENIRNPSNQRRNFREKCNAQDFPYRFGSLASFRWPLFVLCATEGKSRSPRSGCVSRCTLLTVVVLTHHSLFCGCSLSDIGTLPVPPARTLGSIRDPLSVWCLKVAACAIYAATTPRTPIYAERESVSSITGVAAA
jgi:hypothetical protein